MRELTFLIIAALLEVGGIAFVRCGLKDSRVIWFVLGAIVLISYAVFVNSAKLNFGRLLGIYIAVFFVVSQFLSIVVFSEILRISILIAGILIISGGFVLTFF
jgi:drug/metabolite transporter superfamily protein YnfA